MQNGAYAGSEGFSRRLEALELRLVEKNSQESIETGQGYLKNVLYYSGHVQNIGDIAEVQGGNILGVIGQEKRLEAFSMCLKGMEGYSEGSIEYTAHVQGMAGRIGKAMEREPEQMEKENESRRSKYA